VRCGGAPRAGQAGASYERRIDRRLHRVHDANAARLPFTNSLLTTNAVAKVGFYLRLSVVPHYISGRLSLLPSVGRQNEYQPKGGDALRLGSKGRRGVICR